MGPPLSDVLGLALLVEPPLLGRDAAIGTVETWDSMQQLVLMSLVEQTYGVRFTDDEVATATSVPLIEAALALRGVAVAW